MKYLILLAIVTNILFAHKKDSNILDFKIAIDIGHTPKTCGAISYIGVCEYSFNKRLTFELLDELHRQGIKKAFLINPDDVEISLNERVTIANLSNADLFISIHHDSVQEKYLSYHEVDGKKKHFCDKFSGYSIFYSKLNKKVNESFMFSKLLADELLTTGFIPTLHHAEKIEGENREIVDTKRGIYQFENLIVLKKTEIPAILLETGIIVNRLEEQKLNKKSYRKKIIDSIVKALIKYNYINTSKKDTD